MTTTIFSSHHGLHDGTRLAYLVCGPSTGEPVILLHGIPTGAELWRDIMPRLAEEGFRCYAPDLPGFGRTRLPKTGDYSIFATARRLHEWIESEQLRDVWLIGHDWGGAVSQAIAARYDHHISRLTLSNCPVEDTWPVTAVRLFRLIARMKLYAPSASIGLVPNPYANSQLGKAFYDPQQVSGDIWKRVFWDTKVNDRRGRIEFQRYLASLDNSETLEIAPELAGIKLPTLLIWGSNDRFQPWEKVGVRLKELLPDPDVKLIQQAGHFHVLEKPEAFIAALLDWRPSSQEDTE